jgi:hypothetical protein
MPDLTDAELADFRQWATVMATANGNGGDVRAMQALKLLAAYDAVRLENAALERRLEMEREIQ